MRQCANCQMAVGKKRTYCDKCAKQRTKMTESVRQQGFRSRKAFGDAEPWLETKYDYRGDPLPAPTEEQLQKAREARIVYKREDSWE